MAVRHWVELRWCSSLRGVLLVPSVGQQHDWQLTSRAFCRSLRPVDIWSGIPQPVGRKAARASGATLHSMPLLLAYSSRSKERFGINQQHGADTFCCHVLVTSVVHRNMPLVAVCLKGSAGRTAVHIRQSRALSGKRSERCRTGHKCQRWLVR